MTPVLNGARYLETTIQSVLSQDCPDLEYVVADGGSTDGTLEILRRYEGRLRWSSAPDSGQAAAINRGLATTSGAILAYLNADDCYRPGAVKAVMAALEADPGVDLVYGDGIDRYEATGEERYHASHPCTARSLAAGGNVICQPAAFFTRRAYERLGGFDERYRYAFDYDFWIRILQDGRGTHLAAPLAVFRFHAESKTGAEEARFWPEVLAIARRHGGRGLTPLRLQWALSRWLPLARLRERAPGAYRAGKSIAYRLLGVPNPDR